MVGCEYINYYEKLMCQMFYKACIIFSISHPSRVKMRHIS